MPSGGYTSSISGHAGGQQDITSATSAGLPNNSICALLIKSAASAASPDDWSVELLINGTKADQAVAGSALVKLGLELDFRLG